MTDDDDYIVFGRPLLGASELEEVADSFRRGWIGTGPKVASFERELEQYCDAPHVRCVASCTAALILAMATSGIGRGDEVIVPAMTFVATANAVEHAGATPVFVDCDPSTGLIDLDAVAGAITRRTRAVIPVHLAGRPVDLPRLAEICAPSGVAVIEDAAHALGAAVAGRPIGGHGNLVCFSFYVTKNITTIEGGAVVSADPAVAAEVETLALHGLSLGAWQRFSDEGYRHYEVVRPGYKFNMTDVQASVGLRQLPFLDEWIEHRARQWQRYDEALAELPVRTPQPPVPGSRHARHLYTIEVQPDTGWSRDDLMAALHKRGVGSGVHYRGVHVHEYYRSKYGLKPEMFPVSTRIGDRTLSLPLGPALTDAQHERVIDVLSDLVERGPDP